jgi:hypothetical protein
MKRGLLVPAILATVWFTGEATTSLAGGYDSGKATGSCSFSPSTAGVGQPYAVNAVGLPTDQEVDLFILSYETGTRLYPNLAVNSNGTWSGTFTQSNDGKFTFEFDSPSKPGGTRLATKDAVCSIMIR